jgi:hypothetical protein
MQAMADEARTGRAAPDDDERPWLDATAPAVGLTLAVLGLMLLAQAIYPGATWAQTAFAVVVELVSASAWAVALYVGTIVTLITMPALLGLGVALLVAAVVRATSGGGFGWQAIVGAVLVVLGWSCVLEPPVGGPFLPIVLVAIGAGLLSRRRAASATPPH